MGGVCSATVLCVGFQADCEFLTSVSSTGEAPERIRDLGVLWAVWPGVYFSAMLISYSCNPHSTCF